MNRLCHDAGKTSGPERDLGGVDKGASRRLITFAYAGMRSDGAYFWGLPLAQRLGINSIGFVARGLNWYPRASVLAAIGALQPLLGKHNRRITYGSSQGGYAALKYARALGAGTSISFVPQYSIDPSVVGDFDQRFTQHFRSQMNAGMEITADDVAPNSFMVVDPHHPVDLRNAELIQAAAPSVQTIITPHTHHRPVLTIASSSVAMRMLNAALAGDALAISRELAAARRRSPHRTYHLFRAAAFRHPKWAV